MLGNALASRLHFLANYSGSFLLKKTWHCKRHGISFLSNWSFLSNSLSTKFPHKHTLLYLDTGFNLAQRLDTIIYLFDLF